MLQNMPFFTMTITKLIAFMSPSLVAELCPIVTPIMGLTNP